MKNDRYERQIRFFGKNGQSVISKFNATVVGVGGIGSHIVQQLSLLGLRKMTFIDSEELSESNKNRYITARYTDAIPGTTKVQLAKRLAEEINPDIQIETIFDSVVSDKAFQAIITADYVFGCLDSEGARFILNELCLAYSIPYIDLATDIIQDDSLSYGGRVCTVNEHGCLLCLGVIDIDEAQIELAGPKARKDRDSLYGVNSQYLDTSGPSVVSINGIIASLGVTEFMLNITGIRSFNRLVYYHGHKGIVTVSGDSPKPNCPHCKDISGKRDAANVQRYIKTGVGEYLR